jgi:hypothetical protein
MSPVREELLVHASGVEPLHGAGGQAAARTPTSYPVGMSGHVTMEDMPEETTVPDEMTEPAWHQALAYAVTGRRIDGLGRQLQPNVPSLARQLEQSAAEDPSWTWSTEPADHLVPAEMLVGIGAAQFWAALADLRRTLGITDPGGSAVTTDRPLTVEEIRLSTERPPHH